MHTDSNSMIRSSSAQEANATLQAISDQAKAENLSWVAELSESTDEAYVAAHIRGMVAATLGHLSYSRSGNERHEIPYTDRM